MTTTTNYRSPSLSNTILIIKHEIVNTIKINNLTPWALIVWRWRCISSRGHRSLTAPRSRGHQQVCQRQSIRVCASVCSGCDCWHQKRRVFGGGKASLAASEGGGALGEEEKWEEALLSSSLFLHLLLIHHSVLWVINLPHLPFPLRAPAPWTLWWRCL